ncbi:MAG: hypothetical protein US79_C0015G0008 [Parcubacteria group bacterium GW2011_GWC1_38_17]|nr:MAG: hypothetical protein US61_C0002G0017 [Parcubacteria group bacterium GW2011_GWE2_37_8]KKQ58080.1 MAG: hypothetical protein US79_C0015G0008 [Parcubacteria group bacterium GW2011_GWC1_38_17]KKQ58488.1 MAG: hypothetical protein US78_C0016G0007 [Parcubacteria group bacterium GW2011_GWD1_38_16]
MSSPAIKWNPEYYTCNHCFAPILSGDLKCGNCENNPYSPLPKDTLLTSQQLKDLRLAKSSLAKKRQI